MSKIVSITVEIEVPDDAPIFLLDGSEKQFNTFAGNMLMSCVKWRNDNWRITEVKSV